MNQVPGMPAPPMPLPRNMEHAQSLGMAGQRLGSTNVFVANSANSNYSPSSSFSRPPRFPNLVNSSSSGGVDTSRYSMTPTTKALYAFGESPSKDLDLINRAVNGRRSETLRQMPNLGEQIQNAAENDEGTEARLWQAINRKRSRGSAAAAADAAGMENPATTSIGESKRRR